MRDKQQFNPAPVLEVIQDHSPEQLARSLDEAYYTLSEHLLTVEGINGQHYLTILVDIRILRDALLKGAGITIFEK